MTFKRKLAGFTLIEIMVVIAILSTIAAISIPRFVQHRLQIKQQECKKNLTELLEAERAFFNKHSYYTSNLTKLDWLPQGSPLYLYGFFKAPDHIPHTTADQAVIMNCAAPPCYSTELMTKGKTRGPLYGPLTAYDLPHNTFANENSFQIGCVGQITDDARLDQATINHEGHFESVTQISP